jgi:hypothetical protein
MLCIHSGCRAVSRQEMASIPTPPAIGRHVPVSHAALADSLIATAQRRGLAVRREQWGIARDDLRLYGAVDFDMPQGFRLPAGIGPSLGVRHANDKTMSVQLTAGVRVLVCDNGALLGELEVTCRKHTSGLDLGELIGNAFDEYLLRLPDFNAVYDRLAGDRLTENKAKSLIVDAFDRHQVMAWRHFPAVVERYFHSDEHRQQFPDRNRWGLYNAFTETFKAEPVTLQTTSFHVLTAALDTGRN